MGRVEEMASENAKVLLNRAIEACLSEDSITHQLNEVSACVQQLEDYRNEIPDEMGELQKITNILASAQEHLSPERELELSERLLTLYISVCDGALVF
jgi:flagellin-specific chaperone FliS